MSFLHSIEYSERQNKSISHNKSNCRRIRLPEINTQISAQIMKSDECGSQKLKIENVFVCDWDLKPWPFELDTFYWSSNRSCLYYMRVGNFNWLSCSIYSIIRSGMHMHRPGILCNFENSPFTPITFPKSRNSFQCVDKNRLDFTDANVVWMEIRNYRAKTWKKKTHAHIITLFRFTLIHSVAAQHQFRTIEITLWTKKFTKLYAKKKKKKVTHKITIRKSFSSTHTHQDCWSKLVSILDWNHARQTDKLTTLKWYLIKLVVVAIDFEWMIIIFSSN